MKNKDLNKINIHYLCKDIDLNRLIEIQVLSKNYQYVELSKTVHIFQDHNLEPGEMIIIFKFGVVIFWFVSSENQQEIIKDLSPVLRMKCKPLNEEYEIFYNMKMQKIIQEEVFYLEHEKDEQDILLVSYSLAQYMLLKKIQENFQ